MEVEKRPTSYEDLPWYGQLIYDGVQLVLPYVVNGLVDLTGRGVTAGIGAVKRKVIEHKAAQKAKNVQKKSIPATPVEQKESAGMVVTTEKTAYVPDDIDVAYERYSINMTSEEAQKEFVDAFILRLLSEKNSGELLIPI